MRKILLSLLMIVGVMGMVAGSTRSVFSDTETSNGNTFAAGSIDLDIDGLDENVLKFTLTNLRPGNQLIGSFTLTNSGVINGKLNMKDIKVTSYENECIDPEKEEGDTPEDLEGELEDVLNVRLFVDTDGDGWISAGENVFYNGKVKGLPASFPLNHILNAGTSVKIAAIFDWWNTEDDNKAMTDEFTLDLGFELVQN